MKVRLFPQLWPHEVNATEEVIIEHAQQVRSQGVPVNPF